jgi:hypothetical protein
MTICNLNVLVAAIYRFMHKAELDETNESKTGTPSTHFSFAPASRNARVRNLPHGHQSVLGPPLAVAVGGLTTGGPLGGRGIDGGVRIHTETVEWSHTATLEIKGPNGFSTSLKDIPSSLDLEDSEDGNSEVGSPGKMKHEMSFDRDLERGDSYPLRNFSRPAQPNSKSNSNSKLNDGA